jgi:uncharacterized protein YjiS (DUF1127 family)
MSESLVQNAIYGSASSATSRQQYSAFNLVMAALNTVLAMVERQRQHRALAGLNEHQLRDIGISAAEARCAAAKPFWR